MPGQGEHGRVCHGLHHRDLLLRSHPQPLGPGAGARGLLRRGRRRRGGAGLLVCRGLGHRRVHPPARRLLRRDGDQAHLWGGVPLWPHRLRLLPGPDGPPGPGRRRLRRRAGRRDGQGPQGRHQPGHARRGPAGRAHRGRAGHEDRHPRRLLRRRPGPRGASRRPPGGPGAEGPWGGAGGVRLPGDAVCHPYLLYYRRRRGQLQPVPVRRGEIRLAGGGL